MASNIAPIHPGEHLAQFLEDYDLSQYALAKAIGVSPRRIHEIIKGNRSITADTALRLARYFNTSAQLWLNLQTNYDLKCAQLALGDRLRREIRPREVA